MFVSFTSMIQCFLDILLDTSVSKIFVKEAISLHLIVTIENVLYYLQNIQVKRKTLVKLAYFQPFFSCFQFSKNISSGGSDYDLRIECKGGIFGT